MQAMGITKDDNCRSILDGRLRIEPGISPLKIVQTSRVGISKAADQPWRFYIAGNQYISKH